MSSFDYFSRDLELISENLSKLKIEHAFVGGATIAVYLSSVGVAEIRPTEDIDCVIKSSSRPGYNHLCETLRKAGFKNEPKGPLCRWNFNGVIVDIMPTNEDILRMPSQWFEEGLSHSQEKKLPSGKAIRVFSLPHLIATKLDAFKDRGKKDMRGSQDIEDIVSLLDSYPDAFSEIKSGNEEVKTFLKQQFKNFLEREEFEESIHAHIQGGNKTDKLNRILREIRLFVSE